MQNISHKLVGVLVTTRDSIYHHFTYQDMIVKNTKTQVFQLLQQAGQELLQNTGQLSHMMIKLEIEQIKMVNLILICQITTC